MSAPDLERALGRTLREAQSKRLPSVAAAVFRGEELLWQDAVGLADAAAGREATPDTQYRIGSITKTFTAVAVLRLRDAGLLALDDRLGDHVPGAAHGELTLRRLLSHSSGLQREPPGEIWESLEMPSRAQFLEQAAGAERVLEPGLAWHYSNLAFALLGEVVEQVARRPYREVVGAEILAPLGLARTTWAPAEPWARGYLADPYADVLHDEQPVDLSGTAAAGQLWSTVGDLARWGAFLAAGAEGVLARTTVEEMRTVQAMRDRLWRVGWGLGLALIRRGDTVWAGHDGAMPGHLASLVVEPESGAGAAVLVNEGAAADPVALALALAERSLELVPPEPAAWRPGEPPPPEARAILGRWWSEGEEHVLRWRAGRLEAEAVGAPEHLRLSVFAPEGEDRYRVVAGRERGELLRVVRGEGGAVEKLLWATYPFTRGPRTFGG